MKRKLIFFSPCGAEETAVCNELLSFFQLYEKKKKKMAFKFRQM